MSADQPPEPIVFFADYCFGKRGAIALRERGYRVEWLLDHFEMDARDVEWLPIVSQRGWVILSADKAMKARPVEFEALLRSGARMFVLARGDYTGQAVINIISTHLDKIIAHVEANPGPYIVSLSTKGFRVVHPRPSKEPKLGPDTKIMRRAGRQGRAIELD